VCVRNMVTFYSSVSEQVVPWAGAILQFSLYYYTNYFWRYVEQNKTHRGGCEPNPII
jgi:hypothetical protein